MTTEVTNEGIIVLQGSGEMFLKKGDGNTVMFTVMFEDEKDCTAFFNVMHASLQVGCIHIHFQSEDMGRGTQ